MYIRKFSNDNFKWGSKFGKILNVNSNWFIVDNFLFMVLIVINFILNYLRLYYILFNCYSLNTQKGLTKYFVYQKLKS